jgi:hypothetical protein
VAVVDAGGVRVGNACVVTETVGGAIETTVDVPPNIELGRGTFGDGEPVRALRRLRSLGSTVLAGAFASVVGTAVGTAASIPSSKANSSGTVGAVVAGTEIAGIAGIEPDSQGSGDSDIGVTPAVVAMIAAALARITEGIAGTAPEATDAADAMGAASGPRNEPMRGTFASAAIGPLNLLICPTEIANIARTTAGSNWVPAPFRSSRRATSIEYGFLYERAIVITANASATDTIRPVREMFSPASPYGYPFPSQRSW